ncbi:hypothetical protein F7D09_0526 [Bifidobacterium leontopitheci]|uniref:Uncharacterized protein n=1 Tax=Bifidobacterium leontopitheci TaxID=2650774 RepID=A0A6I1GH43_9BIFI|nr:hypothetical protein F7D09_0526 [Bifidobacterium leontopitheci]
MQVVAMHAGRLHAECVQIDGKADAGSSFHVTLLARAR